MTDNANIIYENPTRKPLGDLYFSVRDNGVSTKVPALSKHWLTSRVYQQFRPLPIAGKRLTNRAADLDQWLAETDGFRQQLEWLLQLEHFRFWSHMVYDPQCITSVVVSFLQEALPFTTPLADLTTDTRVTRLYQQVFDLELKIIFRLSTDRESDDDWIRTDHHAKLVYDNFLLTVPIVFDLLITYGRSNSAVLTQLVERIFASNSRLQEDLKEALAFMKQSFASVQDRLNENSTQDNELADLAAFTLDCASTVALLLEVAGKVAIQAAVDVQLDHSLTNFYDLTLPALYKQIYSVNAASDSLVVLNRARMELLAGYRSIINSYLETILNEPFDCILSAEYLLAMLQEALSDPVFVVDYKRIYHVMNDIDIVQQACPDLDTMKIEYLIKAYSTPDEHFLTTNTYPPPPPPTKLLSIPAEEEGAAAWPAESPAAPTATNDDIQTVLDVLPHLQPMFVAKLLQRYENSELAIAAVLEGNLPPDLDETTSSINAAPEPVAAIPASAPKPSTSKLASFGFSDSVIVKRNKGFPGAPKTLSTLLDDKSHVRQMRSRYQEYGLVPENDYDDEYDDSYDALAESETKSMRVHNPNRIIANELQDDEAYNDDDSSSEEEAGDAGAGQPAGAGARGATSSYFAKSKDFCENPELARERRAQNWNNKMGAQAPRRPARTNDVVGKPKGQGQDAATAQSRQKKEANKSSKANHSRRTGAAWKRNTGMIPS